MLNRTPESFKTDLAPERPDEGLSLLTKSGRFRLLVLHARRRFDGLLALAKAALQRAARWQHSSPFLIRVTRSDRTPDDLTTAVEPQRPDEGPLALAVIRLRRFGELMSERWQLFARAASLSLRRLDETLESLKIELEKKQREDGASLAKTGRRRFAVLLLQGWHFFVRVAFSSLSRRIIFLNVTGLLALVIGILYLSQFRAGLIDARIQSLLVQGEIIAGAVAASATVETDTITIDPERLLDLQAGQSYGPSEEALSGLEFPINPERVAPVLRRLVSPTNTRARIYDRAGVLILDSRNLYIPGEVLRFGIWMTLVAYVAILGIALPYWTLLGQGVHVLRDAR